jgi:hypothetical protein
MSILKYHYDTYDFSPTGVAETRLYSSVGVNVYSNQYQYHNWPYIASTASGGIPDKGYIGGFVEYSYRVNHSLYTPRKIGHINMSFWNTNDEGASNGGKTDILNTRICNIYREGPIETYANTAELAYVSGVQKFDFYPFLGSGYMPKLHLDGPEIDLYLLKLKVHMYVYKFE